jgi:quercetin dioxygenase-like cupin family protein
MERRRRSARTAALDRSLHLHRNDDEAWYVLEGTLCLQVGKEVVEAHAGSAVFVARGTAHTYWNPDLGWCDICSS